MLCGGQVKIYIEPLFLSDKLYIIGAGHCGKALGKLARLCGFYVYLIDNAKKLLIIYLRIVITPLFFIIIQTFQRL